MGNRIFQETLLNKVNAAISQAKTAIHVQHHGLAGDVREILITNILTELLPEGFRIGTGKVADSVGNLSNQTDIIIYNKSYFPPIMFDTSKGIFPIESVAYVIEVKTTLNATEIKTSIEKAEKLRTLKGRQPHFVLFAFNSDIDSKEKELKRIHKYFPQQNPALNIYCIVDKSYGYYDSIKWNDFTYTDNHYNVISLITGILNTLMNWKTNNSSIVPGHYFEK